MLDAVNSIFKFGGSGIFGRDFTFLGLLKNELLQTRRAVIADTITIPSPAYYCNRDIISAAGVADDSLESVSCSVGTISGGTPTTAFTGTMFLHATKSVSFTVSSGALSGTITASQAGSVEVTYNLSKGPAAISQAIAIYIYRNGSKIYTDTGASSLRDSCTFNVNEGDTVSYYADAEVKKVSYALTRSFSAGTYLLTNSDKHEIGYSAFFAASGNFLTVGTAKSSGHVKYTAGRDILSLMSGLESGTVAGASGSLSIDGTARAITSVLYQITDAKFYWASDSDKEITTDGYYEMSGSFTPEAQTAAVLSTSLLPLVPADDSGNGNDVGTGSKPYRNGYFRQINEQGTANKVWGAVAN